MKRSIYETFEVDADSQADAEREVEERGDELEYYDRNVKEVYAVNPETGQPVARETRPGDHGS